MNRSLAAAAALILATLAVAPAQAQLEANLGAMTEENVKGYLSPFPTALSATMNSAIFRSGYIAKDKLQFQVGVHAMAVTFDDEDRLYTPTTPPDFSSDQSIQAPTVIGSTQYAEQFGDGGAVQYYPGGFDIQQLTVAAPQISIGGFMGTQLVARWFAYDIGDEAEDADFGEFKLFGIGVQHSISQYVPTMPFDLAIGGFYQNFEIGEDLLDSTGLHLNATASKRFSLLEPYIGIGYDQYDLTVRYDSEEFDGDEIEVEFDTESNFHFTAGSQLHLGPVHLHGEYNAAAETSFAVGLGVGM